MIDLFSLDMFFGKKIVDVFIRSGLLCGFSAVFNLIPHQSRQAIRFLVPGIK